MESLTNNTSTSLLFDRNNAYSRFDLDTMNKIVGENGKIIAYLLSDERLCNIYVIQFSKPIIFSFLKDAVMGMDASLEFTASDPVHIRIRYLTTDRMMFDIYTIYCNDTFGNMTDDQYENHVITMGMNIFDNISKLGIYHEYNEYSKFNDTSDSCINKELKRMAKWWNSENYKLIGL